MEPVYLNLFFLILLGIWLRAIWKLDWQRIGLNRALVLSFVLATSAPIVVRYGNNVEEYLHGLNYFHDFIASGRLKEYGISVLLTVFSFLLLCLGLKERSHKGSDRNRRTRLSKTSRIKIVAITFIVFLLFFLSLFIVFLVFVGRLNNTFGYIFVEAFFKSLIFFFLLPWTGVLAIGIGATLIFITFHSSELGLEKQILMYSILILHIVMPWFYPNLLEARYRSGFKGGFAEAVKKNVDIASIQRWMAKQPQLALASCDGYEPNMKIIEILKNSSDYAQLPETIRNLKPEYLKFCREADMGYSVKLIMQYSSPEFTSFGLVLVYPPESNEVLKERNYDYGGFISEDCSCYIYEPGSR